MNPWIKTKDKLPDEDVDVLLSVTADGDIMIGRLCCISVEMDGNGNEYHECAWAIQGNDDESIMCNEWTYELENIQYWMPLPSPPSYFI